jgi:hypothetical protein
VADVYGAPEAEIPAQWAEVMSKTKRCPCPAHVGKRTLPLTTEHWHRHKGEKGGFAHYCKKCARVATRKALRRLIEKRRQSNLCCWCGKRPPSPDRKTLCEPCAAKANVWSLEKYWRQRKDPIKRKRINAASRASSAKQRARKQVNGVCINCGCHEPMIIGTQYCAKHGVSERARHKARNQLRRIIEVKAEARFTPEQERAVEMLFEVGEGYKSRTEVPLNWHHFPISVESVGSISADGVITPGPNWDKAHLCHHPANLVLITVAEHKRCHSTGWTGFRKLVWWDAATGKVKVVQLPVTASGVNAK